MQYEIFTEQKIKINKKDIDKVIKKFAKVFKIPKDAHLSIAFVAPSVIKNLNSKYRKINKVTDVLSFGNQPISPLTRGARGVVLFFNQNYIGEIIICYEQVENQAKDYGTTINQEILRLLTHGLVHLMGYDHKTVQEEGKMVKKEKEIFFTQKTPILRQLTDQGRLQQ